MSKTLKYNLSIINSVLQIKKYATYEILSNALADLLPWINIVRSAIVECLKWLRVCLICLWRQLIVLDLMPGFRTLLDIKSEAS